MSELPPVKLSVVIPCHNEEGNIARVASAVAQACSSVSEYELLFVDDGSTDGTLSAIRAARRKDPRVRYISLSRNFGHQCALKAGMDNATGTCVVSLDADLQHPPAAIPSMIAKWREGYDVVLMRRRSAAGRSLLKRGTAWLFHRVMRSIAGVALVEDTADFRLLDKRVVRALRAMHEPDPFIRGLVAWAGFRQCVLDYDEEVRSSGASKYTVRRMVRFASVGLVSFSVWPLRLSLILGTIVCLCAMGYAGYVIYIRLSTSEAIPGWASTTVAVLTIGGIQLVCLGAVGEYLGRTFMQSKERPQYIISDASVGEEDCRR